MFTLTINGLKELIRNFQESGVELPAQFQRAMTASVVKIKQDAQDTVPVKTGALRTSITEIVERNPLIGRVSVGQPYGKYVEFGTPPHIIEPISASALRFSVGGNIVFAKRVNHPGTKAKPFMEPAFRNNVERIKDNFSRAAQAVIQLLARR